VEERALAQTGVNHSGPSACTRAVRRRGGLAEQPRREAAAPNRTPRAKPPPTAPGGCQPFERPALRSPRTDVHRRPGAQPTQASNCAWQARVPSAPNLHGQGGDQLRLYTVPSRLTTALASARVLCAHLWQARAAARLLIGFNKCNAPPLSKVEQLPGDGESGWPAADDEYVYLLGRGLCAQGGGGCDVGEVHILVRSKRALETREGSVRSNWDARRACGTRKRLGEPLE